MVQRDMEFSVSSMKDLLKSVSDLRVSKDSAIELNEELEEYGEAVSQKAIEIAEGKGRVTIRPEDIKEAIRELE